MKRATFVFVCLFLSLAPSMREAIAEAFPIKIDRPHKVGDVLEIRAQAVEKRTSTQTKNGVADPARNAQLLAEFEGSYEVRAVDARGMPTQVHLSARKFSIKSSEHEADALPADVVIDATLEGSETKFESTGGVLSDDVLHVLQLLFDLEHVVLADEMLGTDQPKMPGEKWPVNAENVARALQTDRIDVAVKDVSGISTLVRSMEVEGQQYLEFHSDFEAANLSLPTGDLPAGYEIRDAAIKAEFNSFLPLDESQPLRSRKADALIRYTITGGTPGGADHVVIGVEVTRTTRIETAPITRP